MSDATQAQRTVLQRAARKALRVARALRPHGLALLYHRIAEPTADPFDLAVSPAHFAEHVDVLRRFGPRLTFGEFAAALMSDRPRRRTVCITFDDGYRDNLEAAAPILIAADTPATVFAVSGAVGAGRRFWWDSVVDVFLSPGRLPGTLALRAGGETRRWDLGDADEYSAEAARAGAGWRALAAPPGDGRQRTMLEVWTFLSGLEVAEAERLADEIADWAGAPRALRPEAHPVDLAELRRLADSCGVEIGGHTVTHPRLPTLTPERRLAEMRDSRIQLGEMIGREVASFAYPFGAECPETARLAGEAGYRAACTTHASVARPSGDPLRIPRFVVGDWDGDRFERELRRHTMF